MNNDDNSTIETIRTYAQDIDAGKSNIKTLREQIKERIEQNHNYAEVERLTAELKKAKDDLKYSLMQDSTYNDLMETLGSQKEELKENEEVLSDYLVEHYVKTHEKQVEMNPANGDAREVLLKGKLGQEQKYQTNLFLSKEQVSEAV